MIRTFRRRTPEQTEEILWRVKRGELRSRFGPGPEALQRASAAGEPFPVGGGMPVKDKWALGFGLAGRESGWDIPDLVEYDYAFLNLAGATTYNGSIFGIMPGSNASVIGSPDSIPAALTVANGGRVVGSGGAPYASLLSAWIFARTSAGAVYAPGAGSTLQLQVVSAGANANQAATNLTAALSLATLTQFWTQQVFTAIPAERQITVGSTALTTAVALFTGDTIFGQFVVTGALNVQGNSLLYYLELA